VHPMGSRARVLLTSVFGPYARDDDYGSRAVNPMELCHGQVTREQGPFSVRMFHRSWGIMLIQANISAPCTVLDFPSLDRFIQEIKTHEYDIVGITSIMTNERKVKKMCELIRQHLPKATIVVGGHLANFAGVEDRVDADCIVKGDGVRWMRRFLSEDEDRPINHPQVPATFGMRTMGAPIMKRRGDVAAVLIPSVGCPIGCNFCATSAMFGGKGKYINFYETGDELFEIMCQIERGMQIKSFFVMDENFLLHRKRALRLLDLMVAHNKSWGLFIFSSANALRSYTMEQLVGLGISWVWMGIEGKNSKYGKLSGIDTHELVRELQSHGICVLGSTIIGLEEHTPQNLDAAIDYAVSHDADFHQFMLYIPIPGTPFWAELEAKGALFEVPEADVTGQTKFNYIHPHIKNGEETEFLLKAFRRDLEMNGPSIVRTVRTTLQGWKRYKDHPDQRIRERYAWQSRDLAVGYAAALWATARWYRSDPAMRAKITAILDDICREFGLKSRLAAPALGAILRFTLGREDRRLSRGWTYEPPTLCETKDQVRSACPAVVQGAAAPKIPESY